MKLLQFVELMSDDLDHIFSGCYKNRKQKYSRKILCHHIMSALASN